MRTEEPIEACRGVAGSGWPEASEISCAQRLCCWQMEKEEERGGFGLVSKPEVDVSVEFEMICSAVRRVCVQHDVSDTLWMVGMCLGLVLNRRDVGVIG
jgi:hypothetical protein